MDADFRVVVGRLTKSGDGSISGPIWITVRGRDFPETGWNDLPLAILGMWLHQTIGLLSGQTPCATFPFMDGPFRVELRKARQDGYLNLLLVEETATTVDRIGPILLRVADAVDALLAAGTELLGACRANGWETADTLAIQRGLEALARRAADSDPAEP